MFNIAIGHLALQAEYFLSCPVELYFLEMPIPPASLASMSSFSIHVSWTLYIYIIFFFKYPFLTSLDFIKFFFWEWEGVGYLQNISYLCCIFEYLEYLTWSLLKYMAKSRKYLIEEAILGVISYSLYFLIYCLIKLNKA